MIFGVKEQRTALGQFTSEKCSSCKNSNKYIFYRITKFLVVFFINLIPILNRYECECAECGDTIKIDKKAGKKLASQKFSVENSNQNFLIFVKLFMTVAVVAAAVVLPMILIAPPMSPDMIKSLVDETGEYTIVNEDDSMLAVLKVVGDNKTLLFYNDISDYKNPEGKSFELHKFYEEKVTDEGSYMAPIIDDFGSLIDNNNVKVQRYYYDIAKGAYGYAIGVQDLATIEYSDKKAVYPISYIVSDDKVLNYKLVIYTEKDWEIDVRYEISEDGTEQLLDILFMEKQDGRVMSETMYLPTTKDGSVVYLGNLTSASTGQELYNFIKANGLEVSYVDNYTYYKNSNIIMSSTTTTTDSSGNPSVTEEKYDIVKKYNYYILKKMS